MTFPPMPEGAHSGAPPPLPPTGRTGPPWEQPGEVTTRFVDTAKGVLLDPTTLFRQMRREGGIGQPFVYGLIGLLIGSLASVLYQFALGGLGWGFPSFDPEAAVALPFAATSWLITAPILAILVLFIFAGLYHLMLTLLGGARFPFETTFRVAAYSAGSTALLQLVPMCGGLIFGVWNIVASIIGLAQAHEIETGKSAVAVLAPVVLCCVLVVLFSGALLALIFGAAAMAGSR